MSKQSHTSVRSHKYHQYTDPNLFYDSLYGMPILSAVNVTVERLIPWKPSQKDYNGTVHFYMDDEKFSSIATYPRKYIEAVKKYHSVIQPDFSHYPYWNYNVQRWSHFLRQWVGAIWSYYGKITVIPNVHIPPDESEQWEFYWAGLPQHSLLTLSCMDASDYSKNSEAQAWFLNGIKKVIERLHPTHIIYYGGEIKKLEQEYGSLITWFNRQQFIGQKSIAKRETYTDYYKLWNNTTQTHTGDDTWDNQEHMLILDQEKLGEQDLMLNQEQLEEQSINSYQQQKQCLNQSNNSSQQILNNDEYKNLLNENEFERLNYLLNELKREIVLLSDNSRNLSLDNMEKLLLAIPLESISKNLPLTSHDMQNLNNELLSPDLNQKLITNQDSELQNRFEENELHNNEQNQLLSEQHNQNLLQQRNQNDTLQKNQFQKLLQKQQNNKQLDKKHNYLKQEEQFQQDDNFQEENLLKRPLNLNTLENEDINSLLQQRNNENPFKKVLERQTKQLVDNNNLHNVSIQELQEIYQEEQKKELKLETNQLLFKNFSKDIELQKRISKITLYHHDLSLDTKYVIFCSGHSFLFYLTDYLKQEGYNIVKAYLDYSWLFPEVRDYLQEKCDVAVPLRHQLDEVLKKRGWPNLKGGNRAWHSRELEFAVDDFLKSSGAIEILPYHSLTSENLILYRDKRETGFTCPLFGYCEMQNYIPKEVYSFEKLEGLKDICETHYLMPIKGMKYSSLRNKIELEYLFKESYTTNGELSKLWQEILELDLTIESKNKSFGGYSTLLDLHYEFEGRMLETEIDEYIEVPSGRKISLLEKRIQTIEKAIEEQNWLWTLNHREKERWSVVKPLGFSQSRKRVKVIGLAGEKSLRFLPITNLYQRPSENYFGRIL